MKTDRQILGLDEAQSEAVRCALADLTGAWQAWKQDCIEVHDWRSHELSIIDLANAFDLNDELPEELK